MSSNGNHCLNSQSIEIDLNSQSIEIDLNNKRINIKYDDDKFKKELIEVLEEISKSLYTIGVEIANKSLKIN